MKFYSPEQCTVCGDVADTLPLMLWGGICRSYHAGGDFKTDFDAARHRRKLQLEAQASQQPLPPPTYAHQSVDRSNGCGVRVSAFFKFCPEDDYVQSFGIAAPAWRLHPLLLEDGVTTEKGVLIRRKRGDSPDVRHMRDVELYRFQDNAQHTRLLDLLESLREEEAADTLVAAHKEVMDKEVTARCCVRGRTVRERLH